MKTLNVHILVFLATITFLNVLDPVSSGASLNDNSPRVTGTHMGGIFQAGGSITKHMHQVRLSADQQEYLDAHNAFRNRKCVPPIGWNPVLQNYAYNWALARKQDCDFHHHSKGPYGENQFWEQYDELNPRDMVKVWADEEIHWDYTRNKCKCKPETLICQCGHYVALIWKSVHSMGCANVTCDNEKGILVVCEYDNKGWANENPLNPKPGH